MVINITKQMEFTREPNMTSYGAYSDEQILSKEDLSGLVDLATSCGVMVIPEIDAPAHMGAGWQWGESAGKGSFVLCADFDGTEGDKWTTDSLEPPSGQLNLANQNVYPILKSM